MRHLFPLLKPAALFLLLAAPFAPARAQTGGVRIGTAGAPDPSAALDVSSTAKGLLPPRLSTAQRDALPAPAAGLLIFNTSTSRANQWDGLRWTEPLALEVAPVVFAYTGAPQTYTVPAGVTSLGVDLAGGSGGPLPFRTTGHGLGGRVQAAMAVTPGEVLTVRVGGAAVGEAGGYNGGGSGEAGRQASGGGGATDLARAGLRLLVAGGGGGGGFDGAGGAGGGLGAGAGGISTASTGGGGGTQAGPGAGGVNGGGGSNGNPGSGAAGGNGLGGAGAGGGGYFGGGAGADPAGGGGGSSFAGPGTAGAVLDQGLWRGDGYVRLTLGRPLPPPAPVLDASNFVGLPAPPPPQTLSLTGQALSLSQGNTVTLPTTPGDNLGTHVATQPINLNGFELRNAARVGIGLGNVAPTYPLDVAGAFNLAGTMQLNTGDGDKIFLTGNSVNGSRIGLAAGAGVLTYAGQGNGSTPGYHAWLLTGPSAYQEQLRLGATGLRVGPGTGAARGRLDLTDGDAYLVANANVGSAQSVYLPGHLFLAPYSGGSGTAYVQARVPNPTASTSIGLVLRTTDAGALTDALTLAPNGDVRAAGALDVGLVSVFQDYSLVANGYNTYTLSCPAGTRLVSGGGGHPAQNPAQPDVVVNYSGPDDANPTTTWLLRVDNRSSTDARAVRIRCNCARIR